MTVAEAKGHTDWCLALLRSLVECESPTGDRDGNLRVAGLLEDAMIRAGGRVERIPAPGLGVHLLGRFRGVKRDWGPVLVMGHMDTVHPVGTLRRLPFAIADGKAQGPGIYDMKSGLAVVLTALRILAGMNRGPASDVTFLVTCDEERGSPDSRARIEEEARGHRAALVPEPSAPGGAVKSRRKGVSAYVLEVAGRAAHAGIEPEAGASAIHELARQVCWIYELADPTVGTSVSVGVIKGGTTENVVADAASCSIDVRFFVNTESDRVDNALRTAVAFDSRCTLTLKGGLNRGALEKSEASGLIYKQARLWQRLWGSNSGKNRQAARATATSSLQWGVPRLMGWDLTGEGRIPCMNTSWLTMCHGGLP